jgi:hypothetical protein
MFEIIDMDVAGLSTTEKSGWIAQPVRLADTACCLVLNFLFIHLKLLRIIPWAESEETAVPQRFL